MIVTRGYGTGQLIATRGYGTSAVIVALIETKAKWVFVREKMARAFKIDKRLKVYEREEV
jgi:hypothetical protein